MNIRPIRFGNTTESGAFEIPEGASDLIPSPDANRIACVVPEKKAVRVEVNARRQRVYDAIRGLKFSPDSRAVAYAANHKRGWSVVFDEEELEPWDEIGPASPIISPDSKHVTYTAKRDGFWYAILDEKVMDGPFEMFLPGEIVFSSDSRRLLYAIRKGAKDFLVVDSIEREGYPRILDRSWRFSPNSIDVAFVPCTAGEWHADRFVGEAGVMVNRDVDRTWRHDERGQADRLSNEIYFSPDSEHVAYVVTQSGQTATILDARPLAPCDGGVVSGWDSVAADLPIRDANHAAWKSGSVAFSPDSRHLAFGVAARGAHRLIVDGIERGAPRAFMRRPILFSPDSARMAYGVQHGIRQYVVLDGKQMESFDSIAPVEWSFSPNSAHFACIGLHGNQYHLMVDSGLRLLQGVPVAGSRIVWEDDDHLHLLVTQGRKATAVRHGIG